MGGICALIIGLPPVDATTARPMTIVTLALSALASYLPLLRGPA